MAYGATTAVSIDRTKQQIEALLAAHGASRFGYALPPPAALAEDAGA